MKSKKENQTIDKTEKNKLEMEDKILDNIKSSLDSLSETTSWALLFLFITYISAVFTSADVDIGSIKIPREISGVIIFSILFGVGFKCLFMLQNIEFQFNKLEKKKKIGAFIIRAHHWILNPFTETDGWVSILSDNFGFSLLILLWWLGADEGFYLLNLPNIVSQVLIIGRIMFFGYLLFGLIALVKIFNLLLKVCEKSWAIRMKYILAILSIPIGVFVLPVLLW